MRAPRKAAAIFVGGLILALGVSAMALAGFKPANTYPTVPGKDSLDVAVANLTGDGKLDLAVSNRAANNVSVLRGTGTGRFGAAHQYAAGSMPWA